MLLRVLGLAALLAVGACARQLPPVNLPPSVKSVAIVPAVPSEIRIATTGMTRFEDALDLVEVSDWKLDDIAWQAANATLAPRVKTVRAATDGPVADAASIFEKAVLGSGQFESQLRTHVHTDVPVDLYLVISPSNAADMHLSLPNVLKGVGVSKMRSIIMTHDPKLHAFLQLSVVDAKTFKVIETRPLRVDHAGHPAWVDLPGDTTPVEMLEGFAWKDYWHEMSDALRDLIRERLTGLVA